MIDPLNPSRYLILTILSKRPSYDWNKKSFQVKTSIAIDRLPSLNILLPIVVTFFIRALEKVKKTKEKGWLERGLNCKCVCVCVCVFAVSFEFMIKVSFSLSLFNCYAFHFHSLRENFLFNYLFKMRNFWNSLHSPFSSYSNINYKWID